MLESQIKRRYRFKRYVLIKLIVVLALTIVLVIAELLPLAINMLNNGYYSKYVSYGLYIFILLLSITIMEAFIFDKKYHYGEFNNINMLKDFFEFFANNDADKKIYADTLNWFSQILHDLDYQNNEQKKKRIFERMIIDKCRLIDMHQDNKGISVLVNKRSAFKTFSNEIIGLWNDYEQREYNEENRESFSKALLDIIDKFKKSEDEEERKVNYLCDDLVTKIWHIGILVGYVLGCLISGDIVSVITDNEDFDWKTFLENICFYMPTAIMPIWLSSRDKK